ncbi:PEP-CTERM system TPR-repeat protein PrsT [Niveibacterium sp. 24ML]|uniref:XrtA/PEP-CTERM system TPR-repeat protein PrsT n=1 Tax=Niveibacterium sp. 24ML TaxID=2985512 RepID=UPI002270D6D7|nr:XrtA/PEP-CTERM system TPR-repeat protein PrsT [Niveibacterium sp. 24ML]MCX9157747.1 PEP-CTERM system TPR-repeat protein PrsT [Niveibacterium sp. 24ML]
MAVLLPFQAFAADPDKAARFYEDALARYQRNDYTGTVIQLKNALQQNRKMLAAHVLLGRALLAVGDAVGAETSFNTAIELGVDRAEVELPLVQAIYAQGRFAEVIARGIPAALPASVRQDLLIVRGSAEGELNDHRAAKKSFDEARAIDPRAPTLIMAEASQALRVGDLPRALSLSQQAITLAPQRAEAWAARGAALAANRQQTAALDAFGRALTLDAMMVDARLARIDILIELDRDAEAAKDLEVLRTQAPADPRAAYRRGVLAARKNDVAGVAREMAEVVKAIDVIPPEIRARRANLLLIGGMAHYSLNNTEKARANLESFLRLQPYHPGATRMLAAAYLSSRDVARATTLLEDYLRRVPADAQARTLLGSAYLVQKRYAKASALLERAVSQGSADAGMRATFGASLAGQGLDAQAALQLRSAFETNPADQAIGASLAVLLLQRGEAAQAVAVLDRLFAANPRSPIVLNLLGLARARAGDRAGARKAYEAAIAVDPRFDPARLNLARLDIADGNADAARARLQQMLREQPANADALVDLALLDRRAGKVESAQKGLEKAMAVAPRHPRAPLILIEDALAAGDSATAVRIARTAAAAMPSDLPILLALARSQLAAGDTARAKESLGEARKRLEGDPAALVQIARMQIAAAHLQGAAISVSKALEAQSDFLPALELQAEISLRNNDLALAERQGRAIVERYPGRAAGYQVLGDVALSRGQMAAGLAHHRTAYERERTADNALRAYRAFLAAGEPARGLALLQEYQQANKSSNDLQVPIAIAEAQIRSGDLKAAKATLEALIKRSPQTGLLNNYALVLLQLGDPGALGAAERAWRAAPNDPQVIDTYGWVLAKTGQLDRGLGYLRDARLRSPRDAEIRFHLAWVLAKVGRIKEARDELSPVRSELAKPGMPEEARKLAAELGV